MKTNKLGEAIHYRTCTTSWSGFWFVSSALSCSGYFTEVSYLNSADRGILCEASLSEDSKQVLRVTSAEVWRGRGWHEDHAITVTVSGEGGKVVEGELNVLLKGESRGDEVDRTRELVSLWWNKRSTETWPDHHIYHQALSYGSGWDNQRNPWQWKLSTLWINWLQ